MSSAGTAVILAAGEGTRMRSSGPKVLHPLCGRPMLAYVLDQVAGAGIERVDVVIGKGADAVRDAVAQHPAGSRARVVVQEPRLGTGHAVSCCLPEVGRGPAPAVVLYGDMPLVRDSSLRQLAALWRERCGRRGIALLTAELRRPGGLGRIVRQGERIARIVEEKDASAEERALCEVNLGVYAFDPALLARLLPRLSNQNAQGEYYLTDLVAMAVAEGLPVHAHKLEDEREVLGVNTPGQLADAREAIQARILDAHLEAGVLIEDPRTTYVDWGVEIGAGTRILPCTVIRSGVKIGKGCEVGPFSHLRHGTVLEDGAEVGNFTETKQARLGAHTKAKHLSYLGDVTVGARANIGAGTIVANYDGKSKHHTRIGDGAFIGSGSVLIAPSEVGAGALTGGGAVVTRNTVVPPGEAWVGVPARPLRKARPENEART
jgi:bifunctional UDP-N-acetylglucosamine pyrophosphorylase/glucosamine-1-phosphate N-acetyltransferase